MKFSVLERFLIQNLLPEKGSYTNLKLMRVAREALSFDEAENKALNFTQEGEQIKWLEGAVPDKEIELGEVVTQMVIRKLKELDEAEDLKAEQVALYEKFIQ